MKPDTASRKNGSYAKLSGYGRAVRGSLLLGGCIYYFTPDFSPGRIDDICFIGVPVIIILLRVYILRRKNEGTYVKNIKA